jgi:hypothetical protein
LAFGQPAAFAQLLDPESMASVYKELADLRYCTPGRPYVELLRRTEQIRRTFDEGNAPSVKAVVALQQHARASISATPSLFGLVRFAVVANEQSSNTTPELQAADWAAGYARQVYLEHGLRVVCEEFCSVIFNGSMIRDFRQTEERVNGRLRL